MMKTKYVYLSYELSDKLSGYRNGKRAKVTKVNQISNGNSTNNSEIETPAHFGTHIDFPYHFNEKGRKGSSYPPEYFLYNKVQIIDTSNIPITEYLITPSDLKGFNFKKDTEILLIKTGFYKRRFSPEYWNENFGLSPDLASFLKKLMPNIRTVGFDLMSISSYKQRDIGRIAHKEFLLENQILIIEDMDFSNLYTNNIKQLIVSPLRYQNADGSPVTIIAEIYN